MIYDSRYFLFFLPVAFALYWLVPVRGKMQNAALLLANIVFYGAWDWRFLVLFGLSVIWTYIFAAKQWNVKVGIAGLILSLGFFKYFNFFVGNFCDFSLHIILPLGISFYTFMAIGYLCDVHSGKIDAERDLLSFSAFITFFPQVAAGPIGRASEMLPQYHAPRVFSYPLAVDGCRQFLWGAFAKFVVADLAAKTVDGAYGTLSTQTGVNLFLVAVLYAVQIYADFSGYSNMAIGTGKLFGIRLKKNFDCPYFASNIGDFWRRWHISLTTWFRDYVYIPLGGSRVSLGRILFNTWAVFLLSGLWHGAAWTFVIWGGVHAFFLSIRILYRKFVKVELPMFLTWTITVFFVVMAWIFFRSPDWTTATMILDRMFSRTLIATPTLSFKALPFVLFLLIVEWWQRNKDHALCINFGGVWTRSAIYTVLVIVIFMFHPGDTTFIYSQF